MFEQFGKDVCNIFKDAEEEMFSLNHPYVGSEHLLLSLLKNDEGVSTLLAGKGVSYVKFREELVKAVGQAKKKSQYVLYTPLLRRIIESAMEMASDGVVTGMDLFRSLAMEKEGIAIQILNNMGVEMDSIKSQVRAREGVSVLQTYAVLMNERVVDECVAFRDKEVDDIINVLLKKNKCNPLLVGKAGVGKSVLVEELVRRIRSERVPSSLKGVNVYSLSLASLISGTKYRGDFEQRFREILREVEDNNVILFIDEIHGICNCGSADGAVSAGEILKPYLAKGNVRIIGATTEREYYKYLAKDKAMVRRFDVIRVTEPDDDVTLMIMKKVKAEYEEFHNVRILDGVLELVCELGGKYFKDKANPDRSLEILDNVCAYVVNNKGVVEEVRELEEAKNRELMQDNYREAKKILNRLIELKGKEVLVEVDDVYAVMEQRLGVRLYDDVDELVERTMGNLESLIGQQKFKDKFLALLKYKIKSSSGVLSMLLLGNTGVGKTEAVKLISEGFGKDALIRLDMSEYNLETSVNKLIGVSAGYVGYDDQTVFEKVMVNPFSIVLVDEFEKAHPKVLNLFLQILDEGFVTNSRGERIDFSNTIIFFTSNLGVRKSVGFESRKYEDLKELIAPELLGRIDAVVKFDDISEEDVLAYVNKYQVMHNVKLDEKEILARSDYRQYGLRNVKRVIKMMEIESSVVK